MKMMYTTQTREGSGVYNLRVSSGEGRGGRERKEKEKEGREGEVEEEGWREKAHQ